MERKWSAAAHPQWLVFEVESQLQIRPLQYTLAHMLMQGRDGAIAQLNMGEGKTRVILPMLLLALADGERVVSRKRPASMYTCAMHAYLLFARPCPEPLKWSCLWWCCGLRCP